MGGPVPWSWILQVRQSQREFTRHKLKPREKKKVLISSRYVGFAVTDTLNLERIPFSLPHRIPALRIGLPPETNEGSGC